MYTITHCCQSTYEASNESGYFSSPIYTVPCSVRKKKRFFANYSRIQKINTNLPTMVFYELFLRNGMSYFHNFFSPTSRWGRQGVYILFWKRKSQALTLSNQFCHSRLQTEVISFLVKSSQKPHFGFLKISSDCRRLQGCWIYGQTALFMLFQKCIYTPWRPHLEVGEKNNRSFVLGYNWFHL